MERLERDIGARVLLREMLDDLVSSGFARAIADVAWLDDLACGGRDVDNDSWTGRRKRQELFDDVEGADDISVEGELVVCCGDVFAWDKRVGCSDVWNQDVDFADLFEDV